MNADQFRAAMRALPEPPADSAPPYWDYWRHDLWQRAQTEPVDHFWHWPSIRHTMLVDHFPIGRQLAYLQEDWDRWETVVSGAGNDSDYRNLVNQASHLRRWEQATGARMEELETIVEFGGGYGALALAVRRLGFTGDYTIIDLPEFRLLQQWWLTHQNVTAVEWSEVPTAADLFIGIYSLSEIRVEVREQWLASDSYLLLCSSRFADYDNLAWIRQVIADRPRLNWHEEQLEQRPDYYFFGWPK